MQWYTRRTPPEEHKENLQRWDIMQRIFISYSRKDIDFVRKLAGDLEKAGYDVWWDITDLQGGDDWVRTIPDAIASGQYVIVVLTPNSVESEWVRKEYTQALSLRKKIIPIMLVPSSVPFALNTINFVNFAIGEYTDNYKKLLEALGYTDEPPVVQPLKKSLSQGLRKFALPGLLGTFLLFVLFWIFKPDTPFIPPPDDITITPSNTATITPTFTHTPTDTATASASPMATATATATPPTSTLTPTATSTPTLSQAFSLPICIYILESIDANVREGPIINNRNILGKLEPNGTKCPFFSARIANEEKQVWYQIAPDQKEKAEFQQYAGGWIYGNSLAAFDFPRPLPLPICIYTPDNPGDFVYVHILPSEKIENRQENPLKADGTHCPFFDTRLENEEGTWYHFAPNQKEKVEFQQYAGGWIHGDSLVVHTFNLPIVTLTATPSNAPTFTPSSTPTLTRTPTPTMTETPTHTPVPTETDMPVPTDTPLP